MQIHSQLDEATEKQSAPQRHHYFTIDIIRGFAAVWVFFGHLFEWIPFHLHDTALDRGIEAVMHGLARIFLGPYRTGQGYPPVIVFIVLSGFCIHLPAARDPSRLTRPGFWRNYASRRLLRILPLYWFATALGIVLVVCTIVFKPADMKLSMADPHLDVIPILTKITVTTPFMPTAVNVRVGNGPLRTVATEMWLYAAYPLVLLLWYKTRWVGRMTGLFLLYIASLALIPLPINSYESIPRFLVWWAVGVFAAEVFVRYPRFGHSRLGWLCTIGSFVMMTGVAQFLHIRGEYLIRVPLLVLFTACLLISLMSAESTGSIKGNVFVRAFAAMGERSYTLYAIHTPIIGLMWIFWQTGWLETNYAWISPRYLIMLVVCLSVYCVYRWIELPSHVLARKRRMSAPPPQAINLETV